MKFGLLTTTDAPLLGHLIKELISINTLPDAIIFDSKGIQGKDKAIHEDRTEGKIPVIPLSHFKVKIPTYLVESHNDKNCIDIIVKKKIDLLVNAGTPRILKGKILNITKQGIINCHPGLLPDFRGCSCVEWAIYYDKKIGNTIHKLGNNIDDGPIICQEELVFPKSYSYSDIRTNVFRGGNKLLAKIINDIRQSKITSDDYMKQNNGTHYKPIDQATLDIVKDKIKKKKYKYQI